MDFIIDNFNKQYKNKIVRHFKGKYYFVVDIALDTESLEPVVIYRALYGDNKLWTRPLNEFVSLVPDKYKNEYKQELRFEVIDMDEINE